MTRHRRVEPEIGGRWAPDYAPVVRTLAALLDEDPAGGAAVAVYVGGRPVVDVWGGRADPRTGACWAANTLAVTFSCTKGLLADPVARVGFAYLTHRLRNHDDDRAERLVGALRTVLDGRESAG